jgi:glycosyltransferase involved in cell wall biosynthesis
MKPLVLAIPTLNRYDLCRRLIEHVERTSTRKPDSYLIIDNGGAFETEALELGDRIVVYRPGRNLGVSASWNYALRTAHPGKHVAIVNDDVLPEPNELSLLYDCLEAHRGRAVHARAEGYSFFAQSPETTMRVGDYDERFWPAYHEDQDYEHRLKVAGVARIDVALPSQKEGSQTLAAADDGLRRVIHRGMQRNYTYYCLKWGGPPGEERFTKPVGSLRSILRRAEPEYQGPAGRSHRQRVRRL